MKDFYQILGVDKKADNAQINNAYKKLLKKYNKKLNNGDKTFKEKISNLKTAYQNLSDKTKRKNFNKKLADINLSENENKTTQIKHKKKKNKINKSKNTIKSSDVPLTFDFESKLTMAFVLLFSFIFFYLKFLS